MKLVKTASGKKSIKMSKSEWEAMGKKAGWVKEAMSVIPNARVLLTDAKDAGPVGQGVGIGIEIGQWQSETIPLTNVFSAEDIQMMQQDGTLGQPAPTAAPQSDVIKDTNLPAAPAPDQRFLP